MKQDQVLHQSLLTDQPAASEGNSGLSKLKAVCQTKSIDGKNCFQSLFFTWVNPLLSYGNKSTVDVEIMPKLPQNQSTLIQLNTFMRIWQTISKSETGGFTLIRALFKTFKRQWIILGFIVVAVVTLFVATPALTALNIDYLTNHQGQVNYGIFLFLMTLIHSSVHRAFFSQYFYRFISLGIKLSNLVTMIVYSKALKYKPLADKQFSQAQIINYSQVDAQRLTEIGESVAALFYGPAQIICGLIMLYWLLHLAILASVGILIIVLISSYLLSKITVRLNEALLKAKDERMKVTEEMLEIIRFIKITAIQKFFFRKVNDKRKIEVGVMIKRGLNFVVIVGLFYFTCPMMIAGSYLVYILLGYQISPQVAFTTMTVVSLFEYPMYSLPNAVSQLLQITTSLKRIQKFLFSQEINSDHIQFSKKDSKFALQISSGNFYWKREEKEKDKKKEGQDKQTEQAAQSLKKEVVNKTETEQAIETQEQESQILDSQNEDQGLKKFKQKDEKGKPLYIHVLRDINAKIQSGTFTMIVGDIGSGKSSFLLAIINQIISAPSSKITLSGQLAYSPQKPWIMSATLKENITFTQPLIQSKLKRAMHYACLDDDIEMLPKGVETQIGEKGVNISGGQKARVSLARALYSQKDIYLFDDILSAVDVHVGDFIIRETVREFLKGKTVIMPTHAIKFAPLADEIIVMKKGRIVRKGNFKDISKTAQFQEVSIKQNEKQQKKAKQNEQQKQEDLQTEFAMISEVMRKKTKSSNSVEGDVKTKTNDIIEELILPQDHNKGSIDSKVLQKFISLTGGYFKFLGVLIFAIIGYIASKTISSIVIQLWCQNPSDQDYQVYIFIGLNVLSIGFIAFMSYTITISGGKQSTIAHRNVILSLLYASLGNFYNRVPIGRIVNRLTKDLRQLDEAIMASLLFFLMNVVQLIGVLIICVYTTTPLALIPMVIVGFFSNKVRKYYLKTQRQVCRFEKSTNSPVVSGFLSAISGLSTLRAYKRQVQFTDMQLKLFDRNKRVRITKIGLQNWFANALAYMSFFVNMPCIAYCMFSKSSDPSTMGLLMSYALGLSYNIVGLTLSQADFETKLTSLQRVYKFMEIQPQKSYTWYCKNWSQQEQGGQQVVPNGALQFIQLKVRYRKDLPDVIMGITCKIEPGEKVGIVGRTGAGKTTIINTLLGVTEISGGSITIDGKSILDYSLKNLRYSITMIDQEPTLIKSTFRQNLDLTGRYTDQQLIQILKQCNLFDVIKEKGGLDGAVSNTSLSAGQKQLLCICRAFLKQSKIVLIDEATANIDVKNDAIIQKVITEKFKQSTVLTIAHRLSTLKNSDKIMVMEKGVLVQFGDPNELQRKHGGVYSEMIKRHEKEMLS